jgi:hypothetical protein
MVVARPKPNAVEATMIDAVTALKRKKGNIDLLSEFGAWRGGAGLFRCPEV